MIATQATNATSTHSFTRKQIIVTFVIPEADGSFTQFTVGQDHAVRATIKHAGQTSGSEADITITGLTHTDRNSLMIVPDHPSPDNLNTTMPGQTFVSIQAGDRDTPLTSLFIGTVSRAHTDYNDLETPFHVHAMTSTVPASILTEARGYAGPQSISALLADICADAGFQLLDHGGWDRHLTLTNHYRWGTSLDQIQAILHAVKGVFSFSPYLPSEGENTSISGKAIPYKGLLEIWGPTFTGIPSTGEAQDVPIISFETGMTGYPEYSSAGLSLTSLLRPDITFWRPFMLHDTQIPADNDSATSQRAENAPWSGLWLPTFVWHEISSESGKGAWHTHMTCIRTTLGRR